MDDDFDNDIDLPDDNLDESLDLGDLGDAGDAVGADSEAFDDASELGGTRSSGGARANARLTEPEPAAARAVRPPAPKAKKTSPKKAPAKKAPAKKAAAKKPAPKKKAKAAKKKSKPAKRKAGSKK